MGVKHDEASIRRLIEELETVLGQPLPRGGRVVDVASGTGNVAVKLAVTGWFDEVVAVDISSKSLEVAKEHARALGADLTTVVSDMHRLPFDDGSVDFLVGCAFLHHLPDPEAFMAEAHRVLKPGASFVIIGEPTSFGMKAMKVAKFPLIVANGIVKRLRKNKEDVIKWDHDNIDVHDFTMQDADRLLTLFTKKRIVTEGFVAPILDQGIFTPMRFVFRSSKMLAKALGGAGKALVGVDQLVFDRILPRGVLVSLKISGQKAPVA
jgi:ubiquinone/menaquinone biosynthesis C-methylase UbiE